MEPATFPGRFNLSNVERVAVSAVEQRERRKRLVIILVVVGVLLVGSVLWGRTSRGRLDDKTASVESALTRQWTAMDIEQLSTDYANAADPAGGLALFPQPDDAFLFQAHFPSSTSVVTAYRVDASGQQRCVVITVSGPPPNRVSFDERDGDC